METVYDLLDNTMFTFALAVALLCVAGILWMWPEGGEE